MKRHICQSDVSHLVKKAGRTRSQARDRQVIRGYILDITYNHEYHPHKETQSCCEEGLIFQKLGILKTQNGLLQNLGKTDVDHDARTQAQSTRQSFAVGKLDE